MNEKQKKVLIGTAAVIVLMLLYPPWIERYQTGSLHGYDWIFNLELRKDINTVVLLVQWIGALIVGGILFLAFKGPEKVKVEQRPVSRRPRLALEKREVTVPSPPKEPEEFEKVEAQPISVSQSDPPSEKKEAPVPLPPKSQKEEEPPKNNSKGPSLVVQGLFLIVIILFTIVCLGGLSLLIKG